MLSYLLAENPASCEFPAFQHLGCLSCTTCIYFIIKLENNLQGYLLQLCLLLKNIYLPLDSVNNNYIIPVLRPPPFRIRKANHQTNARQRPCLLHTNCMPSISYLIQYTISLSGIYA